MNPVFNKKYMFYDYFPHLSVMRMRWDFGMGYAEQETVKHEVQQWILHAYNRLLDLHDLRHINVYPEIGEEFDERFYLELKTDMQRKVHQEGSWAFLDELSWKKGFENEDERSAFRTKLATALGYGLPPFGPGSELKNAFISLFNMDFDALNGQEILYLTKIQ